MMRNDPEDLADIRFLMMQETVSQSALDVAFECATKLEIPELQMIFEKMQPKVRKVAVEIEMMRVNDTLLKGSAVPLDPDWWSKMVSQPTVEKSLEKDRGIEL